MDPDFYNEWDKKSISKTDELGPQDSKNLLLARLKHDGNFFYWYGAILYTNALIWVILRKMVWHIH